MPTLTINGYVDGDGHVLRGMYNTESKHCIVFNASYSGTLTNCEFPNIDTVFSLINNRVSSNRTTITNCKFAGKVASGYILNRPDDYCGAISGCSFNIKGGDLHFSNEYRDNTHLNCNIKMQTSASWLIYNDAASRTTNFTNCYFTISAPNFTEFTADTGYDSYLWKFDGSDINPATNTSYSTTYTFTTPDMSSGPYSAPGTYSVTLLATKTVNSVIKYYSYTTQIIKD